MFYHRLKIPPFLLYGLTGVLLVILLAFTSTQRALRPCLQLRADIRPTNLHFLRQEQLLALVSEHARRPIIGQSTYRLNLQDIERQLKMQPFVKNIEVYRTHNGNIAFLLQQKEPIARLIYADEEEQYLTQEGETLALSSSFTSRVPLVRMPYALKNTSAKWYISTHPQHLLWKMLQNIQKDPFWRAQIATLLLNRNGELQIHTQLSRQVVYFGTPEESSQKFEKLQIFYTHILPQRGWNKYRKVDIRFKNQIVCK